MNEDRRDFLKKLGIGTAASIGAVTGSTALGLVGYREIQELIRDHNVKRIYNELPKHVYNSETISEIKGDEEEKKQEGSGIVIDGKYFTMGHIIRSAYNPRKVRWGNLTVDSFPEVLSQKTLLHGKKLEEITIIDDELDDLAIFNLPDDLNLPDFPAKPSSDIYLGQEVYVVGNPNGSGTNIRKTFISDLDGISNTKHLKKVFGVSGNIASGDSGCPVVSVDFKLLGLIEFGFLGFGYAAKIDEFLRTLKNPFPHPLI